IFSFGIRKHSNYILDLSPCRGMSDRKHLWSSEMREIIDLQKFPEKDCRPSDVGYFIGSAGSGTPLIKECVLRTFGTANWTQFCPGIINGNVNYPVAKLSFFVA